MKKELLLCTGLMLSAFMSDAVGMKQVIEAILNNNTSGVEQALKKTDLDINEVVSWDMYGHEVKIIALYLAIDQGNDEVVRLLLGYPGINVNDDRAGYTPLFSAVDESRETGNLNIVRLLLGSPEVDVNKACGNDTPLSVAVVNNNVELVKLLLDHPSIQADEMYYDCLRIAVMRDYTEIVELLLKCPKVDANEVCKRGMLYFAITENKEEFVKLLLTHPIKVDTQYYENLFMAMRFDNVRTAERLLKHPEVNVNFIYEDMTLLQIAMVKEETEIVKQLLANPEIEISKECYETLFTEIERGDTEIVKLVLACPKVDVNFADQGCSLLHIAIESGQTEIVKLLLAHPKIEVNSVYRDKTPLHIAVENNQIEIVELLLAHPKIEVNSVYEDKTPLQIAMENNQIEIVELLQAFPNASVNSSKENLVEAAEKGHTKIVELILANSKIPTDFRREALLVAVNNGHTDVVSLLLSQEENGFTDKDKMKALFIAVSNNRCAEVVKLLLADQDIKINDLLQIRKNSIFENEYRYTTFLQEAVSNGNVEAVKLLLTYPGIDVNIREYEFEPLFGKTYAGATPLFKAASEGYTEIVKLLLTNPDVDVNAADHENTPLSVAVMNKRVEMIKVLLTRPDINLKKALDEAFHLMFVPDARLEEDVIEIIKLLIEHPNAAANINDKHGNRWTLLDWASSNGYAEIEQALLDSPGIDVEKSKIYMERKQKQ